MHTVTHETIIKQYESWHSGYKENDRRGTESMGFVLGGEQWTDANSGSRGGDNKESLTFNQCLKHSRRLKAQSREIDLSLNIAPVNPNLDEDVKQLNAYKALLHSIVLSDELTKTFGRSYDQCADYGYSFLEVNYEIENDQSLNTIPVVRLYRDPSMAFWDKSATDPNKIKGRFCGLRRSLSKNEFLSKYAKYKKGHDGYSWLKSKDNQLVDYWYRDYKSAEFVLLKTGSYKQRDLIGENDEIEFDPPDENTPLVQTSQVGAIYFTRYCNEHEIQKPTLFPTDDLPLVYHPACTVCIPDKEDETYPLIYHLQGAQKLHNYINSQIATIAKNSTDAKWLFNAAHVMTPKQQEAAKNINTTSGGSVLGGDLSTIRYIPPGELPMSMLQMSQQSKAEIEELAGSMGDSQSSEQTVLSGVALDRVTHNIGLVNIDSIAIHIEFINVLSKLLRQIIPRIYTEERTLIVKKKDGSGNAVIINQLSETGSNVKNNIKDINNDFHYEITASPSSVMQKENTLKALTAVYTLDPQAWQLTGDIYMRNLPTQDSPELERRIAVNMNPSLIEYSQGEITLKEFNENKQKADEQNMQQQIQQMMQHPEFQARMKEAAAAELEAQAAQSKAESAQFDSETKRIKVVGGLETEKTAQQMKAAEMIKEQEQEQVQHVIDEQRLDPSVMFEGQ